jgi:hypothetical protein
VLLSRAAAAAAAVAATVRPGMRLSAGVANELRVSSAKAAASRIRAGDKSDRATVEQALDPRTRMVRALGSVLGCGVL